MTQRLLLFCCAALALTLAIGCSDDNSTDSQKQTGNLDDPEFQVALAAMANLGGEGFALLEEIYGTIGNIADGPSSVAVRNEASRSAAIADTLVYHESSQYWYHGMGMVETTYVADTMVITEWTVTDSVQFVQGGAPVQYPDSEFVTAVVIGARHSGYSQTSDDSLVAGLAVMISGDPGELAAGGDIVLDGGGYFRGTLGILGPEIGCEFDFLFTEDYNNIGLNLDDVFEYDGCPTSGSLTHAGNLDMYCAGPTDTVDVSGNWSAGFTFAGETISYVFENATTRWTGSTTCGELHTASSAYMLSSFTRHQY